MGWCGVDWKLVPSADKVASRHGSPAQMTISTPLVGMGVSGLTLSVGEEEPVDVDVPALVQGVDPGCCRDKRELDSGEEVSTLTL